MASVREVSAYDKIFHRRDAEVAERIFGLVEVRRPGAMSQGARGNGNGPSVPGFSINECNRDLSLNDRLLKKERPRGSTNLALFPENSEI